MRRDHAQPRRPGGRPCTAAAAANTGATAASAARADSGALGRFTIKVPRRTPGDPAAEEAARIDAGGRGAHRLGEPRILALDDLERRLGRPIARRQADTARGQDTGRPRRPRSAAAAWRG
jgi:hypothetical protein